MQLPRYRPSLQGVVSMVVIHVGLVLLSPQPVRAQATEPTEPVETEARRDDAVLAAFEPVAAQVMGAACEVRTEAGDAIGYGVAIDQTHVLTALGPLEAVNADRVTLRGSAGAARGVVVARNDGFGVALVRVEGSSPFDPLAVEAAAAVTVGQWVVSVGPDRRPLGVGVVSAVDREVEAREAPTGIDLFGILSDSKGPQRSFSRVVQHDSPLDAHKLGSVLVDKHGRLVGINVGQAYRGTVYAVGVDDLQRLLPHLIRGEAGPEGVPHGFLGVTVRHVHRDRRDALGLQGGGAAVVELVSGGPAERAGVRVGDVLMTISGERIHRLETVGWALRGNPPGAEVVVVVQREGRQETIHVVLGERP